ncbi:MAG: TIR domain-containing protein [Planctomycetes bacterium]|nr:TIR domain-containing protein [Planctomycetota bacterium]
MGRKVFYSFHFDGDCWRTSQVRNAGFVEGNQPVSGNTWEAIKRGGKAAIEKWINEQMSGKSCVVVLIGSATAGRPWIDYEIARAWDSGKGVVGVHIHSLKDALGLQSRKGSNPFGSFTLKNGTVRLSDVVRVYDPPYTTSTLVYAYIRDNLATWVDEAIRIRNDYR